MGLVSQYQRATELGDTGGGIAAAGTTQGTATTCTGDHEKITSGTDSQGVILKAGNRLDLRTVSNHTTNSIIVYPPVGAAFNGAPANTGLILPANHGALFMWLTATDITVAL